MIPAIVEECFSEFFKNQTFKVRDVKHGFAYVKNLSADVLVLGMRCVIDDPYHWLLLTASIIVALFLAYGLYYLLFRPANWTRDLTDIGFNHVNDEVRKGFNRREVINRIRRVRNQGNKIPPPFPNGWYGIAESKDVKPGEAISVDCLGENFAIFRTMKGDVHVLDAYCPHLGANLGIGGLVKGDCIECPFHLWAFRGSDGQCVNIPYSDNASIPKSAKVKKWASCEINEEIFVWYHAESPEPVWQVPSSPEVETGDWIYLGRNEFLVNCHIQEIPENGADVAHLNAVHGPNMLAGSDLRFSRVLWASFGLHEWSAQWAPPGDEEEKHVASIQLKHSIRMFDTFNMFTINVVAKQIGPGYVQLHMSSATLGNFIILQTVTPVEPLVQRVVHRFYGPRKLGFIMRFAVWAESIMFERDVMVWNNKNYIDNPLLVKEDKMIKTYRNWFGQFYSPNSKPYSLAKENLVW